MDWRHKHITLSAANLNHLAHKDFLYSPSSSGWSTTSCSTIAEPTKYIEYGEIQKSSVQCTVGAVCISCLLFTIRILSVFTSIDLTVLCTSGYLTLVGSSLRRQYFYPSWSCNIKLLCLWRELLEYIDGMTYERITRYKEIDRVVLNSTVERNWLLLWQKKK